MARARAALSEPDPFDVEDEPDEAPTAPPPQRVVAPALALPEGDGIALDTGHFRLLGHQGIVPAETVNAIRATILGVIITRLEEERKLALAQSSMQPSGAEQLALPQTGGRSERAVRQVSGAEPQATAQEQGRSGGAPVPAVRRKARARRSKALRGVQSEAEGAEG